MQHRNSEHFAELYLQLKLKTVYQCHDSNTGNKTTLTMRNAQISRGIGTWFTANLWTTTSHQGKQLGMYELSKSISRGMTVCLTLYSIGMILSFNFFLYWCRKSALGIGSIDTDSIRFSSKAKHSILDKMEAGKMWLRSW